jgi:hypothetical protein
MWRPTARLTSSALTPPRTLTARNGRQHTLYEVVVVLVTIGLEVEIGGQFGQPLVADALDVFLHEAVVVAPADAGRTHRSLLGAGGDLMKSWRRK